MAIGELLRVVLRRWPVVAVGIVVTIAALMAVRAEPGVYFTRTEIVLLAPTSAANPNALRTQTDDVIVTAGLVARTLSGPRQITKFASPDVTLIGMGVQDGWMIRLPDTGGQWATNFATQRLILDIVGPTRDAVTTRQDELTAEVTETLNALQRGRGVDPINDITAIVAPETTIVYHVGGSRPRALVMTVVLGAAATIAAVLLWDRAARRRTAPVRDTSRTLVGADT